MINEKMRMLGARRSVIRETFEYGRKRKAEIGEENVYDFSLGNPSVPAPDCVNENLKALIENESSVVLHGYTSAQGDASVRAAIAKYINETQGENVNADCLYMTVGAAAALTCTLTALAGEGEEVIVLAPYFPEYKVFIERTGAVCREVLCHTDTFQPDIAAIEAAINEKTAAIIINSPNNPTGAVFTEESIIALTDLLKKKEKELSKTIYLIADEPYRELVYGDATVPYLTKYYDDTLICYSYSKSLSLPGERIGYIAIPEGVSDGDSLYAAVCGSGRSLGYVCAPTLMQKAVAACTGTAPNLENYRKNRDTLYAALTAMGYSCVIPDGAFYLFVRAPGGDAVAFSEKAKELGLLVVPGDDFGCKGYLRISYCVSESTVKNSLMAFGKAKDLF